MPMLSQEQIDFYQANGFLQVDNVLSQAELTELREFIEEAMAQNSDQSVDNSASNRLYYHVLNQKVNTWRDHVGMARYVAHPRFTEMARLLTGATGMRLFHDHALWKMPGDSKPTPWHQDLPYWPMEKGAGALSIWVALDDVDENNGCMMFVPRSHKLDTFKSIDLVNPQDIFADVGAGSEDAGVGDVSVGGVDAGDTGGDGVVGGDGGRGKGGDGGQQRTGPTGAPKTKLPDPVICRMKAGSCTFHSGRTFHYAYANRTDKPRRALAIIYMPEGTVYTGKPHVVTDGTYMRAGEPFHGGLFPLLARDRASE